MYEPSLKRMCAERTRVADGEKGEKADQKAAALDAKIKAIESFRDDIVGEQTKSAPVCTRPTRNRWSTASIGISPGA